MKLDQAKIYKLVDNTNDNIYIGSTCQSLQRRLQNHECDYKRFLKGLHNNVRSFDIIKNNDYKIELLENCNIKTEDELKTRERYYIEHNECTNKNVPGRTTKEYYIDNKNKILEHKKDYYNDNKEKIKASARTNNELNKNKLKEKFACSCGSIIRFSDKARHQKSQKHIKYLESKI